MCLKKAALASASGVIKILFLESEAFQKLMEMNLQELARHLKCL